MLHGLNGLAIADDEKATVLANDDEKVHHLTADMSDDNGAERMVYKKDLKILETVVNQDEIDFVTPRETQIAITRTGSKKAPGLGCHTKYDPKKSA